MILDRPLRSEIAREITEAFRGARVRRVHQPAPDTLVISLRGAGGERRLLVCADPVRARMHQTWRKPPNPPAPPPFCMLARKHLLGRPFLGAAVEADAPVIHARFGPLRGVDGDRILLTLELTGHAATVLLSAEHPEAPVILGLLRPLPAARRDLSPGAPYRPPRPAGRLDPGCASEADLIAGVARLRAKDARRAGARASTDPARLLSRLFEGIGRHLAAEALVRAGLPAAALPDPLPERDARALLASLRDLLGTPCAPRLLEEGGATLLPFPLPRTARPGTPVESVSRALDAICGAQEETRNLEAHRARVLRLLGRLAEHRERKLARQRGDLARARDGERFRREADLLLAQPGASRRGLAEITLVDVFDAGGAAVRIALDPARTLAENAERRYARARKARRGIPILERVIAAGEADLAHLREQALQAAQARETETLDAILETAAARAEGGRPARAAAARGTKDAGRRRPRKQPGRRAGAEGPPRRFEIEGWEVIVGRHGRENDRLVTRVGRPSDLWLHARGVPGAHVLLRCPGAAAPPEDVLAAAARLAAYYSGAREERQADVIVARLDQVRKPPGAPPGQVVVRESRTLRVPATLPEGIAGDTAIPPQGPGRG